MIFHVCRFQDLQTNLNELVTSGNKHLCAFAVYSVLDIYPWFKPRRTYVS